MSRLNGRQEIKLLFVDDEDDSTALPPRLTRYIALAQQFLHGAIRMAQPHAHPKHALALVAAYDQLALARAAVPRPRQTH